MLCHWGTECLEFRSRSNLTEQQIPVSRCREEEFAHLILARWDVVQGHESVGGHPCGKEVLGQEGTWYISWPSCWSFCTTNSGMQTFCGALGWDCSGEFHFFVSGMCSAACTRNLSAHWIREEKRSQTTLQYSTWRRPSAVHAVELTVSMTLAHPNEYSYYGISLGYCLAIVLIPFEIITGGVPKVLKLHLAIGSRECGHE